MVFDAKEEVQNKRRELFPLPATTGDGGALRGGEDTETAGSGHISKPPGKGHLRKEMLCQLKGGEWSKGNV